MPRENNPNILIKPRKPIAKLDDPLPSLPLTSLSLTSLPLPLPLAKPPLLTTSEPQFHFKTTLPQTPLQPVAKAGEWSEAEEVRLAELHN